MATRPGSRKVSAHDVLGEVSAVRDLLLATYGRSGQLSAVAVRLLLHKRQKVEALLADVPIPELLLGGSPCAHK